MMICAEITGMADADSPESEKEWARILREKNITPPVRKTPDAAPGTKTKG